MKICHVITRLIIGGAQENTVLTCQGLHEKGHEVLLVTGPETGPEGSLLDKARDGGYRLEIVDHLRRAVRPLRDWRARRDLANVFREWQPDVVHTHSSKAGILARLAARDARVPIIVHTIHGMSFNRTQPALIRGAYARLERYCARFTDRIVSVADAMSAQAIEAGIAPRDKFITVYSGMRTDLFSPDLYDRAVVRQSWGVKKDAIVVGSVARLFRNKGYEQLIPAMAKAIESQPRLHFVWVGNGAQLSEYETQLRGLGIHEHVTLTGLVPPEQVAPLLSGMDIVVHASQWEGLPRVAVQALLMRVPVISFDIDGAPEVVLHGKTGLLVKLNDIDGLAKAIVALAEDAGMRERMGQAGRELCLTRFDWRTMVDQLDAIYSAIKFRPEGARPNSPGL